MAASTESLANNNQNDDAFLDAMTKLSVWRQTKGLDKDGNILSFAEQPDLINAYSIIVKKIGTLKEGDYDPWMRGKITYLIHKNTKFIIYLDQNWEIQWWWATPPKDLSNLSLLQANITQIEIDSNFLTEPAHKPIRNFFKKNLLRLFRNQNTNPTPIVGEGKNQSNMTDRPIASQELIGIRSMLGEAVAIALNNGTQEQWSGVLNETRKLVILEKNRRCRLQFIGCFLALVAIANIIPHLKIWIEPFAMGETHKHALISLGAGTLGAMVSAISRTDQIGLDPRSRTRGMFTEALARAIMGATAGALASLAIDSGLLDPTLVKSNSLRFFLTFAAGFSERIMPALIGKAETAITGEANKK